MLYFSWSKVSGFLTTTSATVRGLDVGTEYEFRVMAENVMGPSEPLLTKEAIKAKHPFGEYLFVYLYFLSNDH